MEQPAQDRCTPDACGSSALILSFANTRPRANGQPELLGDKASLSRWLDDSGLMDEGSVVTDADAAAARELRDAFVVVFRAHTGCADADAPLAAAETFLGRAARRHPLAPVIGVEGCTLVPSQTGVLGAFGALLAAAADLAFRKEWARLKVCKSASCRTGFFDKTRNSSGLYCCTACSSQATMRAYRSRLKSADPPEASE